MGRPKKELKAIHNKKVRRAKEKIKLYLKGETSYDSLTQLAKYLLEKRRKKEVKPT
jgi:hypothetical protein